MKKIVWQLVLLGAVVSGGWAKSAMVVFDASGSMWGKIDGKPKIEIAKEALGGVIEEWNSDDELGLIVYGHRSKDDCDDIQTLIPMGTLDPKKMMSTVNAITPKGKTPISRSLKIAADGLKYTEANATVILISDGQETCDPNPCLTAKELKKNGVGFIAHVIGFNVDKKTDEELQCIANATGGEYFSAKDANSLNEAMRSIVTKVETKRPKPNLEITAVESQGGKWVKTFHTFINSDSGVSAGSCGSNKLKACEKYLPEGNYTVSSTYNKFKQEQNFEILPNESKKIEIVMGETGEVEMVASEDGKWVKAHHTLINSDSGARGGSCSSTKSKSCTVKLPTGKYIVKSSNYKGGKKEQTIEVKTGDATQVTVTFLSIEIKSKCSDTKAKVKHEVYSAEGQMVHSKHIVCNKPFAFSLDEGNYTVESRGDGIKKVTPFKMDASSPRQLEIDMTQPSKEELIEGDTK